MLIHSYPPIKHKMGYSLLSDACSHCDREQNDSFLTHLYINSRGTIYNGGFHSGRYLEDFLLPTQNYGISKEIVVSCFNIWSYNFGNFAQSKAHIIILIKDEKSIWEVIFYLIGIIDHGLFVLISVLKE